MIAGLRDNTGKTFACRGEMTGAMKSAEEGARGLEDYHNKAMEHMRILAHAVW